MPPEFCSIGVSLATYSGVSWLGENQLLGIYRSQIKLSSTDRDGGQIVEGNQVSFVFAVSLGSHRAHAWFLKLQSHGIL